MNLEPQASGPKTKRVVTVEKLEPIVIRPLCRIRIES